MSDTIWTEDRVQQAIDLRQVGLSASKIAICLGEDFSRNAVIGKLNRLGITCPDKLAYEQPREKYRPARIPHENKITLPPIRKTREDYKWGFKPRRDPVVSIPAPASVYATLVDRTGCAWPVNEGRPYKFCNADLDDPHSEYCSHHRQRMHVQARPAA